MEMGFVGTFSLHVPKIQFKGILHFYPRMGKKIGIYNLFNPFII